MSSVVFTLPEVALNALPDYDTKAVADFMRDMGPHIIHQFLIKDAEYGGSWQQDGIFSVHFNAKRKFDRLHAQFKQGRMYTETNENLGDTLVDQITYGYMYAFYMYQTNTLVRNWIDFWKNKYPGK